MPKEIAARASGEAEKIASNPSGVVLDPFVGSGTTKVLLSIKPEFANRIFDGSKKYEFRKTIFKNPDIKTVVVYASSPVQKVIGEFDIDIILSDAPANLWKKTQDSSGISEDLFFNYFFDKKIGFAIKVKDTNRYEEPLCLHSDFNISPPQSFCYL